MSNTEAWLESLVENYNIPNSESKRGILKESQLKNILNDESKQQKRKKKDTRRSTVRKQK